MIKRYSFIIESANGIPLHFNSGYQLYGVLMAALNNDTYGEALHGQDTTPISQYVKQITPGKGEWVVNLLGEAAAERLAPVLDTITTLHLNLPDTDVHITDRQCETVPDLRALLEASENAIKSERVKLIFRTVTSFKSDGAYAIFPTIPWIINSLINKWNDTWPESVIEDDDAAAMLINGLRISSYRLSSGYYPLKGAKIPGFIGEVTLTARLPAALVELVRPLLYIGRYSGIGIKCALGMGGVNAVGMGG
jgi:CRISPR-associated endoribonuclease Cas6